jgi:hypothetical protein
MLTMRQKLSAAAAAACLATSACGGEQRQQDQASNAANAAQEQVVPKLPIPVPEPPLGREELLVAAIRSASDFAAGIDDGERQKELAGKKFEFRLRFGCGEPRGSLGEFAWSFDQKTGTLKVRAAPTLSTRDPVVKALAGEAFEAVEGVWVRRPWLLAVACPAVPPAPVDQPAETATRQAAQEEQGEDSLPEPPKLVGIAQFFTATGPRTMRRSGRAYEATKRLDPASKPTAGFDLILAGRLAPLPNGRVIACTRSEAIDRPACIISVEFGKVSIERADTHEQLAQWGSG